MLEWEKEVIVREDVLVAGLDGYWDVSAFLFR
jgi:hypothetical protein